MAKATLPPASNPPPIHGGWRYCTVFGAVWQREWEFDRGASWVVRDAAGRVVAYEREWRAAMLAAEQTHKKGEA